VAEHVFRIDAIKCSFVSDIFCWLSMVQEDVSSFLTAINGQCRIVQ
jgi:hypothetical protein